MGKTKLNFVVIFLIQQALALRCFILKQLVVEKWFNINIMVVNCWEVLYMQAFHKRNIFIEEQQVNDINPLYGLAQTSRGQLHIP